MSLVLSNIFDELGQRTVNLVLYVAQKMQDMEYCGATNLGKSLFFIDGLHYANTLEPISTFKYVKRQHGPLPDGRFIALRERMESLGWIKMVSTDFHGWRQDRMIVDKEPDLSLFTPDQLDLINDVVNKVGSVSATVASQFTHKRLAWRFAEYGEELPHYTFILDEGEPSIEQLTLAHNTIEEHARGRGGAQV